MTNIFVKDAKTLINRRVISVWKLENDFLEPLLWDDYDSNAIAIMFDDGTIIVPTRDPEGNGPGNLTYTDVKEYVEITGRKLEKETAS